MPKSKHRKNHKEKVASRKKRLLDDKRRIEKAQRRFIMDMIKKEQENGAFDNTPSINTTGPTIGDSSMVEGPIIEGPSL
jgi:hypothetical protein